ncbi:sterol desaturase family protein [Azospirillum soli]|uniref:sterol desaturase family protein n=1 Tax=Azospirillum soli TaxID=1304799 RepID=UPI001AEBA22E|nr:sterol desaturase family protein [Azospirillum soli]MBP2315906.1 sterol desaturase/sphingolipid hydroxylase (fatty acid hydroxylase superfamily) [Azospirillum soli]
MKTTMTAAARSRAAAWLPGLAMLGTFAALTWLETRRPLRRTVEPKGRHVARNLAIAGLSAATIRALEKPVVEPLAARVDRHGWGLLPRLGLPKPVETAVAVVLLDYTLYIWHVLTHRMPLLWRLHRIHHMDLDLDTSTALRFHAAEMALSVPWRAAQVVLIGVRPDALSRWQTLTLLSILFHHSNLRLPVEVERWLTRVIVTPRMHGIHHSIVPEETGSNWSSGLSLWDRLHGTLTLNVLQDAIVIGVPEVRDAEQVTLGRALAMPVTGPAPTGRLPDGRRPSRSARPVPETRLLA